MSVARAESIPITEPDLARLHFEIDGHVIISDLIKPVHLVPALENARRLASPSGTHYHDGEMIAPLWPPDPRKETALHAALQGMQQGAALLGHDITPTQGMEHRFELHDRQRGSSSRYYQYGERLVGMVAFTNLRGQSFHWFEDTQDGEWVEYTVHPGDVVFQNLQQRLVQRSHVPRSDNRTELVIANSLKSMAARNY